MVTMLKQSWNTLMNALLTIASVSVCSFASTSFQTSAERYFNDGIKGHVGRSLGDLTFV